MPSTFFGLNIAYTGLQAANAWLNTTGNNISNVETEGYSRQKITQQAADALRTHTRYGMAGAGVNSISVDQIRNQYYDLKYWNSCSTLGIYEERKDYMMQIEDYFTETDTMRGFNTIFSDMFDSLDEVYKSPGDDAVKSQFLGQCASLSNYFNEMSTNLRKLQEDANSEIKNYTDQINALASEIATINKQINMIECNHVIANELRDKRALMIDELSKIVDVEVIEVPVYTTEEGSNDPNAEKSGMNRYTVKIAGGQTLVKSYEYNTLSCTARENKVNQSDAEGLYDIKWSNGLDFNLYGKNLGGKLKGLIEVRDGNNDEYFHGTLGTSVEQNAVLDEGGNPVYEQKVDENGDLVFDAGGNPVYDTTKPVYEYKIHVDASKYSYLMDVNKMTLPPEGSIQFANEIFEYTEFAAELDPDSDPKKADYVFTVTKDPSAYLGKEAKIGTSVDYLGIPYYQEQMNEWVRQFSAAMNDIERTARGADYEYADALLVAKNAVDEGFYKFDDQYEYEATGDTTKPRDAKLKTINSKGDNYYQLTAATMMVNKDMVTDVDKFLTSTDYYKGQDNQDIAESLLSVKTDKSKMAFRGCTAQEFLQTMTADIALGTSAASTFTKNYTDINNSINNQRVSVSGVDNDEEALNLVKFREAYNLSAKMMSIMQQIYDRLILQTGV
ncbi:MAG: flagellar hook-associated protein FlgK [Lachnospiraceae bacterium]|nr:flagellar hook-associated protein FlgK [Lachnospiraceae bacterium]